MSHIYKDKGHCNTNLRLDQEFHPKYPENDLSHQNNFYKKIRTTIHQTKCFDNVGKILVGLSGGVDSSVLLHTLCTFQKQENGPEILALHIHHAQRDEESNHDEQIAREIAGTLGCAYQAVKLEHVQKGASEDELRKLRHEKFRTVAQQNNCERIVLGHHMDDQVETFLFRLIRGADLKGLVGMKIFHSPYVRPILECSRTEIEQQAELLKISYAQDSSNFSTGPSRNYLRNIVIPALQAKLDPQVSQHIFDLSQSLAEVESLLSEQAIELIKKCKIEDHVYSVQTLQKAPPVLRKRMIQTMYTYIIKDKGALSRDQIEMIDGWMESTQSPKYLLLPNQVRVEKNKGVLTFSLI